MTRDQFWILISESREKARDPWKQHVELEKLLVSRTEKEILEFAKYSSAIFSEMYRWDLWAVVYIIEGGCSDDGFYDFRGWMMAQGREFFERCLVKPETVAERAHDSIFYEEMTIVDGVAYEAKTGRSLFEALGYQPSTAEPVGMHWEVSDLPKLYPNLCKLYKFRG